MLSTLLLISRRLRTSHAPNVRGCNFNLHNRTETKECLPRISKFKLVAVVNDSKPVEAAELEKYVKMRGKKKCSVKVGVYKTHIEMENKICGTKWIYRFPFENLQEILKIDAEPRLFAFSMFTSNEDYSYYVLISKKCHWFKRRNISGENFADILMNRVIEFQNTTQDNEVDSILHSRELVNNVVSHQDISHNQALQDYHGDEPEVIEEQSVSVFYTWSNTDKLTESYNTEDLSENIPAKDEKNQDHEESGQPSSSSPYSIADNSNCYNALHSKRMPSIETISSQYLQPQLSPQDDNSISSMEYHQLNLSAPLYDQHTSHIPHSRFLSLMNNCRIEDPAKITHENTRDYIPRELSAALDESFMTSSYNTSFYKYQSYSPHCQQNLHYPDQLFQEEFGILQSMDMVVPLHSSEAASCSKSDSFQYIPLHVRDPSLLTIPIPEDYQLSPRRAKDIMDPSVPEHVRKGVMYDEADIVIFEPENDITFEDYNDELWFSGQVETTLVVGCTRNNGLQHLPTIPTKGFLYCFEMLFNAYLNPKSFHEKGIGVSNDPGKIANYLTSCESDESIKNLRLCSYKDLKGTGYWYFPPSCAREPDLDLEVDI